LGQYTDKILTSNTGDVRGTERHAEDVPGVTVEDNHLAGLGIPDLHRPVRAGGGHLGAIGAERHAVDFLVAGVPENDRLDPTQPLEVMSFPAVLVRRTGVEQLFGLARIREVGG
jgi:hypothetical protein